MLRLLVGFLFLKANSPIFSEMLREDLTLSAEAQTKTGSVQVVYEITPPQTNIEAYLCAMFVSAS